MELQHGAHTRFTLHVGICLTDEEESALAYARQGGRGELATIELDMFGLTVVEVEGYDRDANDAPGDSSTYSTDADVLVFDDEDMFGRFHRTWRLMSARAVEAALVVEVRDA